MIQLRNLPLILSLLLALIAGPASATSDPGCIALFSAIEGPFKLGAHADNVVWKKFSDDFKEATRKSIQQRPEFFQQALADDIPYARILKAAGLQLGPPPVVPDFDQVYAYYLSEMNRLVKAGLVKKEEALLPARLFTKDGQIVAVRFGDEIPAGAAPASNSILPGDVFIRFIREGNFPLGEATQNAGGSFSSSMAAHDMSHLAGFLEDHTYMKSFGGTLRANGENTTPQFQKRLGYLSEHLNGLPEKNRDAFMSNLPEKIAAAVKNSDAKASDVRQVLDKFDDSEVLALKEKLVASYPKLFHHLGGANNDLAFRFGSHQSLEYLFTYSLMSRVKQSSDPATVRETLSKFVTGAYRSSFVTPEQFIKDSLPAEIDRTSQLYRYLCASEAFAMGSPLTSTFCN